MTPSYSQIQSWWTQSTLSGRLDPQLGELLIAGGTLASPAAAFAIYLDGYTARLSDSLRESYAAIEAVLGSTDFNEVCRGYIAKNSSPSYNLAHYGADFSEYLSKHEAETVAKWPFLIDLARFEWTFRQVFESAFVAVTPKLASDISAQTVLHFAPCLCLFHSEKSVYPVWKNRHEPHTLADFDYKRPEFLALWRAPHGKVQILNLQNWQHSLLTQLVTGLTLGDAIEKMFEQTPQVTPAEIQSFFSLLKELPLQLA